MKKQIFILVIAFLGIGLSNAFGQAIKGSAPRGISCVDDAKHPIAGKAYIYEAASNQAGNFTFWATKDVNFISTAAGVTTTNMATTKLTTPVDLIATSANYATADPAKTVSITWSDKIIAATDSATSPTFVAALQAGTCANNFKAWMIAPIKAFTVDIMNMNHTTKAPIAYDDATEKQCFDAVRGAKFNAGQVEYDFGKQVLYFEVIAANFTGEYTPTFQISGLGNSQTATLEWDVKSDFSAPSAAVAIANGTPVTSATKVTTNLTNTSTGVSIYVRVTITNNKYEGINATPITLAVDGQNSVGDWDIDNGAGDKCVAAAGADQKDTATQTLDPRPTVTPVTPPNFLKGDNVN